MLGLICRTAHAFLLQLGSTNAYPACQLVSSSLGEWETGQRNKAPCCREASSTAGSSKPITMTQQCPCQQKALKAASSQARVEMHHLATRQILSCSILVCNALEALQSCTAELMYMCCLSSQQNPQPFSGNVYHIQICGSLHVDHCHQDQAGKRHPMASCCIDSC